MSESVESDSGSKFFDVARFSISGEAREEFETMRDATADSETVFVVTESGVSYRVVPRPTPEEMQWARDEDDRISVWGISDREHPRTGHSRFKALGDAELETVPLRTVAGLAADRVGALIRGWVNDR